MQQIRKILLIDDDGIFNMINKKIIQKSNFEYNVRDCVNPDKALDELKELVEFHPDEFPEIIFLDINMPLMDGWQFLDELAKFPKFILRRCKVFILTSSVDRNDIEKSKNYKMVLDFISKPLTSDKLLILSSTKFSSQEKTKNLAVL